MQSLYNSLNLNSLTLLTLVHFLTATMIHGSSKEDARIADIAKLKHGAPSPHALPARPPTPLSCPFSLYFLSQHKVYNKNMELGEESRYACNSSYFRLHQGTATCLSVVLFLFPPHSFPLSRPSRISVPLTIFQWSSIKYQFLYLSESTISEANLHFTFTVLVFSLGNSFLFLKSQERYN